MPPAVLQQIWHRQTNMTSRKGTPTFSGGPRKQNYDRTRKTAICKGNEAARDGKKGYHFSKADLSKGQIRNNTQRTMTEYITVPIKMYAKNRDTGPPRYNACPDWISKPFPIAAPATFNEDRTGKLPMAIIST
jgi:hypothetical protein